jgi:hypothetical protein
VGERQVLEGPDKATELGQIRNRRPKLDRAPAKLLNWVRLATWDLVL